MLDHFMAPELLSDPLPPDGQINFPQLCWCLASMPRALGSPEYATLRVVAYQGTAKQWIAFWKVLRAGVALTKEDVGAQAVQSLGALKLIQIHMPLIDLATPEDFLKNTAEWRRRLDPSTPPLEYAETANVMRFNSRTGFGETPGWQVVIGEQGAVGRPADSQPPRGPFLDPVTGRFATDAVDAARQWLNTHEAASNAGPRRGLEVLVLDPRAVITTTAATDGHVQIAVNQSQTRPLYVHLHTTDYEGVTTPAMGRVINGTATIPVVGSFRTIAGSVFDDAGRPYDSFSEQQARLTQRGRDLFGGELRTARDPSLQQALDSGEGEHVEMKSWIIPTRGNDKFKEILNTLCAFANTLGGTLFIGVTDHLEVIGTDQPLRRQYQGELTTQSERRARYITDLRTLIRDAIVPTIDPEMQWIEYAGHAVCRVRVHPSGRVMHELAESREVYVRAGANNRRAGLIALVRQPE